jgi:hypothetical protein
MGRIRGNRSEAAKEAMQRCDICVELILSKAKELECLQHVPALHG